MTAFFTPRSLHTSSGIGNAISCFTVSGGQSLGKPLSEQVQSRPAVINYNSLELDIFNHLCFESPRLCASVYSSHLLNDLRRVCFSSSFSFFCPVSVTETFTF